MSKNAMSAIGSGNSIANVLLTARECHALMPLPSAAYAVYEAKKCSEKSGAVGSKTIMVIQSPMNQETLYSGSLKIMNPLGIVCLDGVWGAMWKQPLSDLPELPSDCFFTAEEIQHLQSTTTASTPPPPSQE
jgi:hypothetical protein